MVVQIRASAAQQALLQEKGFAATVSISWYEQAVQPADVYMDLLFDVDDNVFSSIADKPVLVHCLALTCNQLPKNFCRINAWPGFLEGRLTPFAAHEDFTSQANTALQDLGWQPIAVADQPGLIAARVVAMIINEAYFGLADNISTEEDIDTAMKLGTNYPYGPFEWATKIGHGNIVRLLETLAATNSRYQPAPLLIAASNK